MLVWENHGQPYTFGTDMVVCKKAGLVYIDNVKAGSTAVQAVLGTRFGCTWTRHNNWAPPELSRAKCWGLKPRKCRATTQWFEDETVTGDPGMLFFSVVREPIDRFVSGFKQALLQDKALRNETISSFIRSYQYASMNEHTQTQARRLSGRDKAGNQVPMHFIASMENLEHDVAALFAHRGLPPVDEFPRMRAAARDPFKASRAELGTALTTADVRLLCAHLMQDFVCFGYLLPQECR
ncbi:hypothetical protein JKP88DRAFT_257730 [Tribonema minus]|uniref:Sulfotransferase family protein n=1 Tax=Tribonema minus TaxID=303371 RepID=A0A835YYH3_9STRA|nr:hypothetical protein JKP88DRAFT_257730 [Tribonema minus]